jgi:hypothetical protein
VIVGVKKKKTTKEEPWKFQRKNVPCNDDWFFESKLEIAVVVAVAAVVVPPRTLRFNKLSPVPTAAVVDVTFDVVVAEVLLVRLLVAAAL